LGTERTPTIRVDRLSRYFGGTPALERVSFEVFSGEITIIVGGNGAGKSTLLAILAGLSAPSEGRVELFGREETRRSRQSRAAVGYAGPEPFLYRDFTLEESLLFFGRMTLGGSGDARVAQVLQQFGLEEHRRKRVRECSQGTVKRASLARAVLHRPQILILDEPLSNLDIATQEFLLRFLDEEKTRGTTVVASSHEEEFVRAAADRIVALRQGRVWKNIARADIAEFSLREGCAGL
jgi:ABC-type multidrug transport system ATPase subunit